MYRFVKDTSPGPKRLFVQGTSDSKTALGPPIVTNFNNANDADHLQAVHTKKRLSTEVLGSSIESTKTSRKGEDGHRRITTKIVRKVTTLTRGEEKSYAEDLARRAVAAKSFYSREEYAKAVEPKRVKVR